MACSAVKASSKKKQTIASQSKGQILI
uniref:Uncharacterized protein n=1 Tax=Anguilla anguilla TaxID=7936 RepID=A0A0E9PRN5_ANGAN